MRPPDLPGGNHDPQLVSAGRQVGASMRPPDLPGGNTGNVDWDGAVPEPLQ